jgi:hypothetical protein
MGDQRGLGARRSRSQAAGAIIFFFLILPLWFRHAQNKKALALGESHFAQPEKEQPSLVVNEVQAQTDEVLFSLQAAHRNSGFGVAFHGQP